MTIPMIKKVVSGAAVSLLLASAAQATELLNSSYDVSRELFAALNTPFEKQWAASHPGDKLTRPFHREFGIAQRKWLKSQSG